jgi:hypothetical protein
MTVKFLLKTGTANVVSAAELASSAVEEAKIASSAVTEGKIASGAVTAAKIANNTITGTQLAAGINLPSDAQLNGTAISSLITAAAGGYDFKEAALTSVSAQASVFSGDGYNNSSSAVVTANLPDIPAYGFVIPDATLALGTAISANDNTALSTSGSRVVFILLDGNDDPLAGRPNGIFVASRGSGKGATSGDLFWSFVRASDANDATKLSLGALVYFTGGSTPGSAAFLSAGEWNSTSALWTFQAAGTTYSAGNGISISGGNAISVLSNSSASVPVTVGASGVSVPLATASVAGAITVNQFEVLKATGAYGKTGLKASYTTLNTNTTTIGLPHGTLAVDTTALVEGVVVSRSTSDDNGPNTSKRCVTKFAFAISRGASGNSVLVGDFVTLFKEHDTNGIATMTVDVSIGTDGVDELIITGATGWAIGHQIYMTSQVV